MTEDDRLTIIAECNFMEELIHTIYNRKEVISVVNKTTLEKRLQSIRNRITDDMVKRISHSTFRV